MELRIPLVFALNLCAQANIDEFFDRFGPC